MFFPYFTCTLGIHSYHALGIAWISDSCKIFKKPLTFECLCFPVFFPYYGNLLFPCFGNCMGAQEKSLQIHEWERYGYSHLFSMSWEKFLQKPTAWEYGFPQNISKLWEFVHSQTLGIAWVFSNSKSVRKRKTWELPVFSHTCSVIWEFTHGLGIVWISASCEICKKSRTLKCLCFLILFS